MSIATTGIQEETRMTPIYADKTTQNNDNNHNLTTSTSTIPIESLEKGMECSWRHCFRSDRSKCHTFCRTSLEDWGKAPLVPANWIPDVTVLRQMYLQGHDDVGNPFPPHLDAPELCLPMEYTGQIEKDADLQLIRGVPIQPKPFSKNDKAAPKLLCLTYTMEASHHSSIRAIRETWAPGCDGYLVVSTKSDPRIPAIVLEFEYGEDHYNNVWQKIRSLWRFVGQHYIDDFDWFYLGGDDAYLMPQNLKVYLSNFDSQKEYFLGRRFKGVTGQYYNSGGAGYVLSRATLNKFVKQGLDHPQCNPTVHTRHEDVMIAACLSSVLNISVFDTRDQSGRERFHPFKPGQHFKWRPPPPGSTHRDWYQEYNEDWGLKLGLGCCAPDSVSFHYIKKPAMMRRLHKLLYDCTEDPEATT